MWDGAGGEKPPDPLSVYEIRRAWKED
jgi:hypothetical protein